MQSTSSPQFAPPTLRLALLIAALGAALPAVAQDTPLISGAVAFLSSTNKGQTSFDPTVMPLVAFPITHRFLFENRDSFLESVNPRSGGQSDQTRLNKNVLYLQMDYFATSHVTFVAGKFLTPFATYNERLGPIWIGNFQDAPLSFPIGNNGSAGTGGEVRGSIYAGPKVSVDYVGYLAANVSGKQFKSSRASGGRVNLYFPSIRLEIGGSYGHMFEGTHRDASGFHVWWQPGGGPVSIKSEYAHGAHAQGYWIETGYRLSQFKGPESAIGRLEPLFRMQQTFRNSPDATDNLPSADTQRADFALDYFLPHEVRIDTSYSRQFSSTGNGNIWKTGLIYRFLFPAWPGKK
jgi:hypothetical protein